MPVRVIEADGQGQMREGPVGVGFMPKRVSAPGRRVNGGPCRPRGGNSSTVIKFSKFLDKVLGMWYNLGRFLDGKKGVRN